MADGSALDRANNVWLATVRADGRPHLTPIWFVYLDDRFWLCCNANSIKSSNVHVNPKVALSLEDANHPVVAEGTVVVHEREYPESVAHAFMAKFGWDITRTDDPEGDYGALFEVTVDRWLMGAPD